MTFICYPKCTTCQKAQKWLDENGISYTCLLYTSKRPAAMVTQKNRRIIWTLLWLMLMRTKTVSKRSA